MKATLRTLAVLALLTPGLKAQDENPPPPADAKTVRIQFVPPPMSGTISLGVYDEAGKLVRTLHREAGTSEFAVGLNGLITDWDGETDAGEPAKPGVYRARGIVAGDLSIEGEAFHGNDWIADDTSPRIRRILNLHARGNGSLVLLAENADGAPALVLCNEAGEIVWNQRLPEKVDAHLFAANGEAEFLVTGDRIARLSIPSSEVATWEAPGVTRLAADDDTLLTLEKGSLTFRNARSGERRSQEPSDGDIDALAVRGEAVVAVRSGRIVLRDKGAWRELPLDSLEKATDVSISPGGTLWVVDRTGATTELKEYALDGAFLRRLGTAPGDPTPVAASSAGEGSLLFLLEKAKGIHRVRALKLVRTRKLEGPGAEAVSTWQVLFSRAILESETPEQALPHLDGFVRTAAVEVTPRANPLTPEKTDPIEVQVGLADGISVLALTDGLPLRTVAATPGLKWAVLGKREDAKGISILQSDGTVIEEYVCGRLGNLMSFDCGTFEFPEPPPTQGSEPAESSEP